MNHHASLDEAFIRRLTEIVNEHIANEHFGAGELSVAAGMSRSHIHRRLKSIKNQSVSHFIRYIRLEKAMKMLLESDSSASEIAYQVGFSSPAYFNRCFHEYYGYPPGEVRKHNLALVESDDLEENLPAVQNDKIEKSSLLIRGWFFRNSKWILPVTIFLFFMALAYGSYNLFFEKQGTGRSGKHSKKSIIVLPFRNLSDNPENQYFADGMMEDILNSLFRISDFKVVSRTTSEHFRGSGLTTGEIARKVNVSNVLEGSVRQQGNMVRITIQLIDPIHDQHLWSANFDRELTNVMGVQGEIALLVADKLEAVLSESEIVDIGKLPTRNSEAYDNYLRGRFLLHKANSVQRADFGRSGVTNCIQYYEKAIAADTAFAEAYAGLANAWFNLSAWGFLPASVGMPEARKYCLKAIECDPDCAEAHAVLGAYFIWGGGGNFTEGSKELKKAVELDPDFATARQWYAQCLMITGPIKEARLHVNRALELEPYFWVVQTLSAWIFYFEKKYDRAIEDCIAARSLNPDFTDNKWLFVLNYTKLGEGEKMLQELLAIIKKYTQDEKYPEEVQAAFNRNGINGVFSWLIEVNNNRPIPVEGMDGHPFYSAWWNAILGNRSEAVYWLEQSLNYPRPLGHYTNLIATNPDFDLLRDDPRFLEVIEKKGLTPYHKRTPKQ
jgi:TolB-like protein/AraC-like DNA-binding protein/tetratricopeptide (TPR) repeat protein